MCLSLCHHLTGMSQSGSAGLPVFSFPAEERVIAVVVVMATVVIRKTYPLGCSHFSTWTSENQGVGVQVTEVRVWTGFAVPVCVTVLRNDTERMRFSCTEWLTRAMRVLGCHLSVNWGAVPGAVTEAVLEVLCSEALL